MTTYALIGNPNVGKTSLYNRLTHSAEHIGNWHGVTVDKVKRPISVDKDIELVDLPGLYSLTVYSKEEEVARDEVIGSACDLFINVCEAGNLRRNLYLFLQLAELNVPIALAVNMIDELEKRGSQLDAKLLGERLGVPVMAVSAKKGIDVNKFLATAKTAKRPKPLPYIKRLPLDKVKNIVGKDIADCGLDPVYASIKVLEGDEFVINKLGLDDAAIERLEKLDGQSLVAAARYEYIDELLGGVISGEKNADRVTSAIDKIALNKYLALPMFLLIMSGIFWVTFGPIGGFFTDLLEKCKDLLAGYAESALVGIGAPDWLNALISEGVINGVGGVIVFLPQIVILFFFLALLEDSGYVSRVAFMTDGFFGKIGLSGRAVFTMIMGFGCSATAVLTSRGLENDMMRKKTAVLTPFVSCSARLPVYTAVLAAFFSRGNALIVFGLYLLGCAIVISLAAVMNGTKRLRSEESTFIMEMPSYRMPTAERVMQILAANTKTFLIKVGTLVFSLNVIVWVLSNFSVTCGYIGMGSGKSVMEWLGKLIAPLFAPLGFGNWKAVTALISGLAAKEVVISTIVSLGGVTEVLGDPLAAICFLVYTLLYVPCIATLGSVKKEVGSKWMFFGLILQLSVAYVTAFAVRMIGLAFAEGALCGILALTFVLTLAIVVATVRKFFARRKCVRCGECGGCL